MKIKKNRFAENEIDVFYGFASFLEKHRIKISRKNGSSEIITGRKFILSTGSRPYQPDDIDFTHPRILDSDKLLRLKDKRSNPSLFMVLVLLVVNTHLYLAL